MKFLVRSLLVPPLHWAAIRLDRLYHDLQDWSFSGERCGCTGCFWDTHEWEGGICSSQLDEDDAELKAEFLQKGEEFHCSSCSGF